MKDQPSLEDRFTSVLGQPVDGQQFRELVNVLATAPEVEVHKHLEGRVYYSFMSLGVEVCVDANRVSAVFLFGPEFGSTCGAYVGVLPFGLAFSDSRSLAMRRAGHPTKALPGRDAPTAFARIYPTLVYDRTGHGVLIEFAMDETKIRKIVLLPSAQ